METVKELNDKILKISLAIKNNYPGLGKYLEEMPVTIPNKTSSEVTLKKLNTYYESLSSLVNKYITSEAVNIQKK